MERRAEHFEPFLDYLLPDALEVVQQRYSEATDIHFHKLEYIWNTAETDKYPPYGINFEFKISLSGRTLFPSVNMHIFHAMNLIHRAFDYLQSSAAKGRLLWEAHDNQGFYVKQVIGGPDAREDRTERMEGWNEAVTDLTKTYAGLLRWIEKLPAGHRQMVQQCLIDERISINMSGDGIRLYVNCNDLFAWGCADAEEITIQELGDLKACFWRTSYGAELWCCMKRKQRPQAAFYRQYLSPADWSYFDACGPERKDHHDRFKE